MEYNPDLISDLTEFLGLDRKYVVDAVEGGTFMHMIDYKISKRVVKDADFYHNNNFQLLDLCRWYSEPGRQAEVGDIIRTVKEKVPKGSKVLDYGCGIGYIALKLAAEGYEVYYHDVNKTCLEFLEFQKQKHGLKLTNYEDSKRPEVDLVVCLDVLEHLHNADLSECLMRLDGALKKGGQSLINIIVMQGDAFPMHLPMSETRLQIMKPYERIFKARING